VRRHLRADWREPVHPGSRRAFDGFLDSWDRRTPLWLDAGCGTADAVHALAAAAPDRFVVGIDRSEARLGRACRPLPANAWLGRARLEDFWRLMDEHGIRAERQFLLYPNPWPKSAQLMRRWHGHPVLPVLLRTAGVLEIRSNWRLYVEEFAEAARLCGIETGEVVCFRPASPASAFERKYAASGHALYRLILNLESKR
jgi:tRNA (guanine-N7-)-methyltransferase